jgi:hypothetical protein
MADRYQQLKDAEQKAAEKAVKLLKKTGITDVSLVEVKSNGPSLQLDVRARVIFSHPRLKKGHALCVNATLSRPALVTFVEVGNVEVLKDGNSVGRVSSRTDFERFFA